MIPYPAIFVILAALALLYFYLSKGQQFDAPADPGAQPLPTGDFFVQQFAKAIAKAEGFGIPGAIPTLAHNPGDLVIPGWIGAKLGEGISVFSSDTEGWNRLYHQLQLIVDGQSRVYTLNDTIQSMANKWTQTNQGAWTQTVASELGATVDVPLLYLLTVPSIT